MCEPSSQSECHAWLEMLPWCRGAVPHSSVLNKGFFWIPGFVYFNMHSNRFVWIQYTNCRKLFCLYSVLWADTSERTDGKKKVCHTLRPKLLLKNILYIDQSFLQDSSSLYWQETQEDGHSCRLPRTFSHQPDKRLSPEHLWRLNAQGFSLPVIVCLTAKDWTLRNLGWERQRQIEIHVWICEEVSSKFSKATRRTTFQPPNTFLTLVREFVSGLPFAWNSIAARFSFFMFCWFLLSFQVFIYPTERTFFPSKFNFSLAN